MSSHLQPDSAFIDLVQRLIDHEASDQDIAALNERLPRDPVALHYLVEMRMLHCSLEDRFDPMLRELNSPQGQLIKFPVTPKAATNSAALLPPKSHPVPQPHWLKSLMTAAALIFLGLGALYFFNQKQQTHQSLAAFEIIAHEVSELDSIANKQIAYGESLTLNDQSSIVELRAPDGNQLTFQGPGELTIHSEKHLSLHSGRLWAEFTGDPVQIQVPIGTITNIGTTFGIDQSSTSTTRIDVFEGKVRFTPKKGSSQTSIVKAGESLTATAKEQAPQKGSADITPYAVGLQRSLASFTGKGIHLSGTGSADNVAVGDLLLYPKMGTDRNGMSFDGIITVHNKGEHTIIDATNHDSTLNLRGKLDLWMDASLTFIEAGSSNASNPLGRPLHLEGVTHVVIKDIDSPAQDLSDVFGLYQAPPSCRLGAGLERGGLIHKSGQPTAEITYSRMRRDLAGSHTDWTDESDQDTEDPDFSVTYAYPKATLPGIRFVWAATTSAPLNKAPSIDGNGRGFTLDLEFSQTN